MIVRTSLSSTGAKNTISQQQRDDVTETGEEGAWCGLRDGGGTKPGILKRTPVKSTDQKILIYPAGGVRCGAEGGIWRFTHQVI